ncbi:hypothetical protein HS121_06960 [bacterium]|nr:hypothetical protein [bacterium]
MRRILNRFCIFTVLLLAPGFLQGCTSRGEPEGQTKPVAASQPSPTPAAQNPEVAAVGPYRILLNDVLLLCDEREKTAHPVAEATPVSVIRKKIRKNYLDQMIERRLLVLGALAHPEWVSDASTEREVQRQLTSLGPDEVERRRKLAGVSKDDFLMQFRRFIKEELMKREILRREVEQKNEVTEEMVKARYENDREKVFYRPDSWAVHHVDQYLPKEKAADMPSLKAKMEALRDQASSLIASATSPEAKAALFAPFARENSQHSDAQTGYAYIYDRLDVKFDPEFVKRVKEATLGELSQVFELSGDDKQIGYCFFLTFEQRPGIYTPYEQAARIIHVNLLKEQSQKLYQELLDRLRQEYKVNIKEENLFMGISEADAAGAGS